MALVWPVIRAIDCCLFVSGGAIGAPWHAATQAMIARGVLYPLFLSVALQ